MSEKFLYERRIKSNPKLNIWMAFPAIYNFGMSSLGYLSIFKTLDKQEDYSVERIFSDTKQTAMKADDIDLLGFSMSFEIDFLMIFKILDKFKIPLKAEDRGGNYPLIFAGGPVLSANPEPFCEFFDFIMVGDAEEITKITECIKENKDKPKKELLEILSKLDGIYIPSLPKTNVKKITSKIPSCITTPILTEKSYFSNTYIIELVRGCPQKCGFCMASYLNLPVRFAKYEQIIENIDFGLKHTKKIAFLGALIAAHPRFDDICKYVYDRIQQGEKIELSVSSLRADSISETVVKTLVAGGQKHSTIAIEAGSDRLRKLINKNLSEEQIIKSVAIAKEFGLKGLKIYAMIGLPTETQEDIDAFITLAKKLKQENKGFDLTFAFSTFVPKAQTPFQFAPREGIKSLEKKYEYLKKHLSKLGIKVRVSSVKWDWVQAIISRGDRRLADYLVNVYKDTANLGSFKKTYKKMEKKGLLPPAEYFAQREIGVDENLPWDFILTSTCKKELIKEYKKLLPV